MSVPLKLAGFGLLLILVFVASLSLGAFVGPVGEPADTMPDTGSMDHGGG